MNRIYTFLVVTIAAFCCNKLSAQSVDSISTEGNAASFTAQMDSILQHVDKERIPYNVLYDRVASFADRTSGQSPDDTISMSRFLQALSELQRADYNFSDSPALFSYKVLSDHAYSENRQGRIPLLGVVSD